MNVKLIISFAICLVGCATAHRHKRRFGRSPCACFCANARSHSALTGPSTACNAVRGNPLNGKCTFTSPSVGGLKGTLDLLQADENSPITITGTITGLTPSGDHGFHVHETADFSNGCTSALAHYNPLKKNHGAPTDDDRHNGDLGNIQADASGTANVNIQDCQVTLFGQHSSMGRSIVVHAMPDDLGKGSFPDSKTTGHAGARVGCCVIGYAHAD